MSTDDELVGRLSRIAAEVDGPPDLVRQSARAALATRRLDEELAELVGDSAFDRPALVRDGGDDARLLSFETASVSVELQLTPAGDRLTLRGLVAGATGEVAVETAHRVRTVVPDAGGWFTVADVAPGPLRLRLRAADGAAVTTSWVSV